MNQEELRYVEAVRDEQALKEYRMACRVTDKAYELAISKVRAGMSELELGEAISRATDRAISQIAPDEPDCGLDFLIIESGERTAMLHGRATSRIIKAGDLVTIDFGHYYRSARSDFTRTFSVGRAGEREKEIYAVVLKAIEQCERLIKPGITGEQADEVARRVIEDAGYGEGFIHSLGHGFGDRRVKERLSSDGIYLGKGGKAELKENMVFTIEPGIYIEGFGGVRIEDTVIMGKNGVEVLFNFTKELIEIS